MPGIHGHTPRRRFGQNFLSDPSYIMKIVAAINPQPDDLVVEIGPGLAAITRPLSERLNRLHVVEIDRDLAARLATDFPPEKLCIHNVDALKFDFATLGPQLRIVGNLPYNISSPILFHLAECAPQLRDMHVMLQKEVVQRMAAEPGTPEYGRLSVMLQYRFRIDKLFLVPPGAFRPAPQVDSMVARLTPLGAARPFVADEALLGRVVTAAFGQRRKTLRNTLKPFFDERQLADLGVDPGARAETLPVGDFIRLANAAALVPAPGQVSTP